MARPKKEIDRRQFEQLCAIQCTEAEICSVLDVTEKTLQAWCRRTYGKGFSQVFAKKRKMGAASLRRMQWKLAEVNATMGIWLGKQYLDQRDNRDIVVKQTIQQETIDAVEAFINGEIISEAAGDDDAPESESQ